MRKNFRKGLLRLADPPIWLLSYVPLTIGIVLGYFSGVSFSASHLVWLLGAYAALGLAETGKNAAYEYFDFIYGADKTRHVPFSGGKKMVASGLLSLKQVIFTAVAAFLAAGAAGMAIVVFKRFDIIYLAILGAGLSLLYVLFPCRLRRRGLGELSVGFSFGPLLVMGGYVLVTGRWDAFPLLLSVPAGLLAANVLLRDEMSHYEGAESNGKKNWAARLGKQKAAALYGSIYAAAYLFYVLIAAVTGSFLWLVPLLGAPLAYKAYRSNKKNAGNIPLLPASKAAPMNICIVNGALLILAAVLRAFI